MGREGAQVRADGRGHHAVIVLGGGIGAGKSTVADRLRDAGFEIVIADMIGHELLSSNEGIREQIAGRWPDVVVGSQVDRAALGAIVFADPAELRALEAILHPGIVATIRKRIDAATGPVVVEVPLLDLVESHDVFAGDGVTKVAVVAEERTRIARAVARGSAPDDVRRRMANQATDDRWRTWADVVIDNSGSWAATERAVDDLIAELARD